MSDLLNQASLVMIPSGYKEDTVYSQIPLDGSGDLSFTRASNGTRINSAGLVEVVAWNLLQYSEDLANGYWQKNNVTINSNTTVAPNGTTTADTFTNSSTGYGIFAVLDVIPSQQYTFSFYIKKGTNTSYILSVIDAVSFNSISSLDYSSQVSATDWVRITQTFTIPSTTTSIRVYQMRDGSTTGTAFLWGAQINIGSTAKSYFPTTDRLNVPRLTYQNGGGGCPSLLLEKQSTNLALYSQEFDNASWVKTNATITANNTTSPDGTQNADLLQSTLSTEPRLRQTATQTGGAAFTFSCFAKKGNVNFVILRNIAVNSAGGSRAWFNLDTGVVGTVNAGLTASMVSYGNGWYRCIITGTTDAVPTNLVDISLSATDNLISGSAIGSNIYLYGAQLEASSYPTSYIPTTSSSATRVADAASKTGISSLLGGTQGTWFLEMKYQPISSSTVSTMFVTGASTIGLASSGTNTLRVRINAVNDIIGSVNPAIRHKIAISFNATGVVCFFNGNQITLPNGASQVVSGLDSLNLETGTRHNEIDIYQMLYFPTRLTNAELASLTTI